MSEAVQVEDKRAVWSWILYDWANSAFSTTVMAGFFPVFFKLYYSAGADPTASTFKLGVGNSVAALIMGLSAPLLGSVADAGSYKKKFLLIFTLVGCLLTAGLAFVTQGDWVLATLLFVTASFAQAAAMSFYDSLLPVVARAERVDWVSVMGYGMGYLGGGILFAFNIWMSESPGTFGLIDKAMAVKASFVTVGVWWLLFTIPLAVWVKEPPPLARADRPGLLHYAKAGLGEFGHTVKLLKRLRTLLFFLLAFFLYNDGVGTTIKMAVDYGMSIGFETKDLMIALLITQFIGMPAALVVIKLTKRFPLKSVIYGCIGVYLVAIAYAYSMQNSKQFYGLAAFIGLAQGPIQALSRSYYARLIPPEKSGEFYGFYNLLGRFAGIIGPVGMGGVAYATGNPRAGVIVVALLFVLGGLFLARVNEAEGKREIQALKRA